MNITLYLCVLLLEVPGKVVVATRWINEYNPAPLRPPPRGPSRSSLQLDGLINLTLYLCLLHLEVPWKVVVATGWINKYKPVPLPPPPRGPWKGRRCY